MDSLFDSAPGSGPVDAPPAAPANAPLAARLRPGGLDGVVGQEHLLHEGAPLRRAIETGQPHSMVLYGPPGTGKTTLARIVAFSASAAFEELSAVNAGKAEVAKVIERARHRRDARGERTVFFLDEIHRFNKAQQDALLPAVEEGLVVLIGATTENPYFEVNSALLSRSQVYELQSLSSADVRGLLERGLAETGGTADDDALTFLAERSGGDARSALAALELAVTLGHVTLDAAEESLQRRALRYDKKADQHYDTISAWIKATRGSDPDASLYYLAIMLEGGEDPRFLARRMVILASEDIGNADPVALQVATATAAAVNLVGMPEAVHALSQCAIYLSLAPKSNAAYRSIGRAREHVRVHGAQLAPMWLRDTHYPGAEKLGRGEGYDYPHDNPGAVSSQELLPDTVVGARFYEPTENEAQLAERLAAIRRARGRS